MLIKLFLQLIHIQIRSRSQSPSPPARLSGTDSSGDSARNGESFLSRGGSFRSIPCSIPACAAESDSGCSCRFPLTQDAAGAHRAARRGRQRYGTRAAPSRLSSGA